MDVKLFLSLLTFSILAVGCGGGDSGGTSSNQPNQSNQSNNEEVSRAVINQQDAMKYLVAVQNAVNISYSLVNDIGSIAQPGMSQYIHEFSEDIRCESGESDTTGDIFRDGFISVSLDNCLSGGYSFDGDVVFRISSGSFQNNNYRLRIEVSEFVVLYDGYSYAYNGQIFYDSEEEIIYDSFLNIENLDVGELYGVNGLSVGFNIVDPVLNTNGLYQVSDVVAKVSVNRSEYIDFEYDYKKDTLKFFGAEGSLVSIAVNRFSNDATGYIVSYDLSLDNFRGLSYSPNISVSSINAVLSSEKTQPVVGFETEYEIDRSFSFFIENTDGFDRDYDPVILGYSVVSKPEGCPEPVFSLVNGRGYDFLSECKGNYEIEFHVDDGLSRTTLSTSISVLGLPAEFASIDNPVIAVDGDLDFLVSVNNNADDGPFEFSISNSANGISIDQSGRVTGDIKYFLRNSSVVDSSVTVVADNGTYQSSVDVEISDIISESNNTNFDALASSNICSIKASSYVNINSDENLESVCIVDNGFKILQLDTESRMVSAIYASHEPLDPDGRIFSVVTQDINGNGRNEIIVGYSNSIFVLDGNSYEVIYEMDAPVYEQHRGYYLLSVSYPYEKIIVVSENISLIDVTGESEALLYNGAKYGGGYYPENLDDDPEPELISLVDINSDKVSFYYDLGSERLQLNVPFNMAEDIDGDGRVDFISVYFDYQERYFYFKTYSPVVWEINKEFRVGDGDYISNHGFIFSNLDSDSELEIVDKDFDNYYIYDVDDQGDYELVRTLARVDGLTDSLWQLFGLSEESISRGYNLKDFDIESESESYSYANWRGILSKPFVYSDSSVRVYSGSQPSDRVVEHSISSEKVEDRVLSDVMPPVRFEWFLESGRGDNIFVGDYFSSDVYSLYNRLDTSIYESAEFITLEENRNHSNNKFLEADFFGDDDSEFIALGNGSLSVISSSGMERILYIPTGGNNQISDFYVFDINDDGKEELLIINDTRNDVSLSIWGDSGESNLDSLARVDLTDSSFPVRNLDVAVQDVDLDGYEEIVVIETKPGASCYSGSRNRKISIFSENLEVQSTTEFALCGDIVLPSFQNLDAKKNVVIFEKVGVEGFGNTSHMQFTISEIDASTGDLVYTSSPLLGRPKPGYTKVLGDDIYEDKKVMVVGSSMYFIN